MLELFLQAAWKVLVAGLVLGAGIPALFALGVRFTAQGAGGEAMTEPAAKTRVGYTASVRPASSSPHWRWRSASRSIVASGFGKMVSFEHVFPTLVDKA